MNKPVEITKEVLEQADEEFLNNQFVNLSEVSIKGSTVLVKPQDSTAITEYKMTEDARNYLATFCGVPVGYIARVDDPEIVSRIWNYHIQKRSRDLDVLKAVIQGDTIKQFTLTSFQGNKPSEVIQACREAIADCVLERPLDFHRNKMQAYLTGPDLYEEFQNAMGMQTDVHHFSIGVSYDFLGGENPSMKVQGHRHHCGNIMDAAYGVTGKQFRVYTTDPDQALNKFTEFTRKGVEFVRSQMIPHIRATMDAALPSPQEDLQEILNKYNVPESVQLLVYESYRAENLGDTMYHLVNALTRAANSERCNPDWVFRLHRIAGEVTVKHDPAHPIRRCNTCHQSVKAMTLSKALKRT